MSSNSPTSTDTVKPSAISLSLQTRLLRLRQQTLAECCRSTNQTGFASTCLWIVLTLGWLAGMIGLGQLLTWDLLGQSGDDFGVLPRSWNIALMSVVCIAGPALIVHVGYTMLACRKLASWAYIDCLRGLNHRAYGLLFTDESMQRALREIQGEHWTETLVPEAQTARLEQTLVLAAENFPAARLLPGGTEIAIRRLLLDRRWRNRRRFFFELPLWAWAAAILLPPVGLLLYLLGGSTFVFLGPNYIVSRARLLAFIDYYMDKPKLDVSKLGPPEEPGSWQERLSAPWRMLAEVRLW